MKTNIIHSIVVCLAAFALPFMVACSSQEESLPEAEGSFQAVFTLNLGDAAYGNARATPTDGEYAPGSGLENFIDLPRRDFRCYLFGTDNRFVSTLEIVGINVLGEGKYSIRSRLKETEAVKNALATGCRFVFLANWGGYVDPIPGMTIGELCTASSAKFEFSQRKTQLSDNNLIPMYGVKEFESGVQDFIEGAEISDIGTLYLLRALAKVEVNVTFEGFADFPAVTSVSLTHSNDKGYKAPANITRQDQYVTGSWLTDYTPVNIPEDATDIGLALTEDNNTGHFMAYVPEYRNVNEQGGPIDSRTCVEISFIAGGVESEGYVDFRYFDTPPTGVPSGQYFDIARNNCYKFNVTVKSNDLYWTVDVIPFTSVELEPDFGLGREDFTGYIVGKDSQGRLCWYDGAAGPYYLGPQNNPEALVTVNGAEYMLVYEDYERTVAGLHHIIEKNSRRKHFLTPEGITGYKYVNEIVNGSAYDMYVNDLHQNVWLDSGGDPNGNDDAKAVYEALGKVGLKLKCCRILYEWERLDWNKARWWLWTGVYPRYWFDVLGNRYPWSEGDTEEKRKAILKEWVQYLE